MTKMIGDISKNFSRSEFECKCGCGFDTVDVELSNVMQVLRDHFGRPVHVTSGNRCFTHNMEEGGARGSKHLEAKANDFWVEGISPKEIYDYLDELYPDKYGIGLYVDRVHFDSREDKARWVSVDGK